MVLASLSLYLVVRVHVVRLLVVAVGVGCGGSRVSGVDGRRGLVRVRVRMEVKMVEQRGRVGADRRRRNLGRHWRAELVAGPAALLARLDSGLAGLMLLHGRRLSERVLRLRLRLVGPVKVILVVRVLVVVGVAGRAHRARVVEAGGAHQGPRR